MWNVVACVCNLSTGAVGTGSILRLAKSVISRPVRDSWNIRWMPLGCPLSSLHAYAYEHVYTINMYTQVYLLAHIHYSLKKCVGQWKALCIIPKTICGEGYIHRYTLTEFLRNRTKCRGKLLFALLWTTPLPMPFEIWVPFIWKAPKQESSPCVSIAMTGLITGCPRWTDLEAVQWVTVADDLIEPRSHRRLAVSSCLDTLDTSVWQALSLCLLNPVPTV